MLAGVAAVGAGIVAYKQMQMKAMAEQDPPPEAPTFVKLAQAHPISFRQNSSAIGTLVAPQWITLSNEVAGTVTEVNLTPGAIAEAGTVLLKMDTSIEAAQLESAKAAAKMSRSKFARTQEAFRTGALTANEMDEAESEFTQSTSRIAELEAIIRKKTLIAPFRARVGLSDIHVGAYIPSGTKITSLQSAERDEDFLYVEFTMPQNVAHAVDVGQPVTLYSGQTTLTATISALDSHTDKVTRNRMARAKIESTPSFMKPGDSVKVAIEYGPEVHAVAIPAEALRRTPSGSQIFVATADDKGSLRAHQRTVQVIQTIGNEVAIFSGVQSGETVVTSGSFKLMESGLLQVAGEAPAADSTKTSSES